MVIYFINQWRKAVNQTTKYLNAVAPNRIMIIHLNAKWSLNTAINNEICDLWFSLSIDYPTGFSFIMTVLFQLGAEAYERQASGGGPDDFSGSHPFGDIFGDVRVRHSYFYLVSEKPEGFQCDFTLSWNHAWGP